tara:strand:- start:236 stop:523 length:288 start_codon:yes stop_codon:yes gene_type:complete
MKIYYDPKSMMILTGGRPRAGIGGPDVVKDDFVPEPDKEVDGRRFQNIDPSKVPGNIHGDALPRYKKDHYDSGGDYDHYDEKKRYWRLQNERPSS